MKGKGSKHKVGMLPGELVHIGKHCSEPALYSFIQFNDNKFIEASKKSLDFKLPILEHEDVLWIRIEGVHDAHLIQAIGEALQLHPLVLEDVMTTRQRPKVDDHEEYLFIVLRFLEYDEKTKKIQDEQVSLVLGKNFVVTFQERHSLIFDLLKERIKAAKGSFRKMRADFLAYSIIDTIVDHYFLLIDQVGQRIEELEEGLTGMATPKSLTAIHELRREIVFLRKSLIPTREVINRLQKDDSSTLITETTRVYLKDIYDHTIQVIDTIDTFRDLGRGLLDISISHMSYRMNEVIKILTVVSTIFVPLTFITSIYGMNFPNIPELHWKYGYLSVWFVMILVALFMIRYFKKKKWF